MADKRIFTPRLRGSIFQALTGRTGDVSGRPDGDVRQMLVAAYGEGKRGGVDTRAAAEGLGVTQRTVQRWVAAEGRQRSKPSKGHLKTLSTKARQSASTQRGRAQAIKEARESQRARKGGRFSVFGNQGPKGYERIRGITVSMAPEDVESMYASYELGGDKVLMSWVEGHTQGPNYGVSDWTFQSVDSFDVEDLP